MMLFVNDLDQRIEDSVKITMTLETCGISLVSVSANFRLTRPYKTKTMLAQIACYCMPKGIFLKYSSMVRLVIEMINLPLILDYSATGGLAAVATT